MAARSRSTGTRGTLALIAGLLVISGAIRFSGGVGPALAREVDALRSATALEVTPPAPQAVPAPDVAAVLAALQAREAEVAAREIAVEEQEQVLALARREIEENLIALEQAEAALADTLATASTAAEDDVTQLTAVYQNMKPKDAALLFEEMDPDFAAGFLSRMRPDAAAAIMAGLQPKTAYSISVLLAGRNADVPTE